MSSVVAALRREGALAGAANMCAALCQVRAQRRTHRAGGLEC